MANEVTIHVKAEDRTDMNLIGRKVEAKAKTSFLKTGAHSGAAFAAGFIKTVTLGMVGSGFAQAGMKLAPQMAHLGGALGVALAAALAVKLASSLSALLPLALGAGALALPIVGIIKKQLAGMKDLNTLNDKIAAQENKIANSKGKARQEAEKELGIMKEQRAELEKQVKPLLTLQDKAKKFLVTISKPVEAPLFKSMKLVGDALDEWGPKFRKAIAPLAKELPGFTKGALKGIQNFFGELGKNMPAITGGFKEWGKQLPGIGKHLGKMLAGWLRDAPDTIQSVQDLAGSMNDLADGVGTVGKGFSTFNKVNDKFKAMIEEQRTMVLKWRIHMLNAVLAIVDAWSLINPRMKSVAKAVRKMLKETNQDVKESAEKTAKTKWEAKIRADKRDLEKKYRESKSRLDYLKKQKPTPQVKADIKKAMEAMRKVKYELQQLNAYTARPKIKPTYSGLNSKNQGAPFYAAGGNIGGLGVGHAAEGGARGGRVLVGEQGPELVDLPFGSHVNSNADSQRIASQGGGQQIVFQFNGPVYGGHDALVRALVDLKRRGKLDVVLR